MKIIKCTSCQSKMTLNCQGFNRLNQLFIQCPYCSSKFWMDFDENMNLRVISNPKLTENNSVKIEDNIPPKTEEIFPPQNEANISVNDEENSTVAQGFTAKKNNISYLEVIIIIVFIFCVLYLIFNF